MKRTSTYICTVENTNLERTIAIRKHLTEIYGPLRARGRHSNRKKVLGRSWFAGTQNDINWKLGETVSFYLHDNNKNYGGYDWDKGEYVVGKTLAQLYNEWYSKHAKYGEPILLTKKDSLNFPQF